MTKKAVVIFSSGLDSSTLLYDCLDKFSDVSAISFQYGSKHNRFELKKAKQTCIKLKVEHQVIDLRKIFIHLNSALLIGGDKIPQGHYEDKNMKQTVIPFRNGIFLSTAVAVADNIKADTVFYGAHAGDHCLKQGTKILTNIGYINIENLKSGQEIFSYNVKKQLVEIDKVNKLVKKNIPKKIIEIKTINGEIIQTTDEHKFYKLKLKGFDSKKGWEKEIIKTEVKNLNKNDYLLQIKYNQEKQKKVDVIDFIKKELSNYNLIIDKEKIYIKQKFHNLTSINKDINIEDLIQILAWYITEGWTGEKVKKSDSGFQSGISQSAKHNLIYTEEIYELLKKITGQVKCNYNLFNDEVNEVTYNISGTLSALFQKYGYKSREKKLTDNLFQLLVNHSYLRNIFLETLIKGDGHKNKFTGAGEIYQYISFSQELLNQIMFLAQISNFKIGRSKHNLTLSLSTRKTRATEFNNLYITKIKEIKEINNDKNVYDIEVNNNHNFFAGENGSILVSNSIYPDCRKKFINAMNEATKLGTYNKVKVIAPFWKKDKAQIVKLGTKLGVDFKMTHTCYSPKTNGNPCGLCGSCNERIFSFVKNNLKDPLYSDKQWKEILLTIK